MIFQTRSRACLKGRKKE
ncbi:MAG: hypothetical protein ACLTML_03975 [Blautia faecis]